MYFWVEVIYLVFDICYMRVKSLLNILIEFDEIFISIVEIFRMLGKGVCVMW